MSKPILLCDFDGVLHDYTSGWKGPRCIPDPPVEGALEFLVLAVEYFDVCIYSSRSTQWGGKRAMKRWLWDKYAEIGGVKRRRWFLGLPEIINEPIIEIPLIPKWYLDTILSNIHMDPWGYEIDYGVRRLLKKIKFPTKKPAAFLTIDDRAIQFNGVFPDMSELSNFKPWNRKEV
jgi:hypothetical protein